MAVAQVNCYGHTLFGWLVADDWCWFVLREEYCWLVAAGCWWLVSCERKVLLADKPSEQGGSSMHACMHHSLE
jgi:hypothetical protein